MTWPVQLIAYLALIMAMLDAASAAGWDYGVHGPAHWAELYPKFCAGDKQSPIDLSTQYSQQEPLIKKFVFDQSTNATPFTLTLTNDGHKVELTWSPDLLIRMGVNSGNLMYTAAQLHWHWGADSYKGSEHTYDKRAFPAEGHLVFYNSLDYANLSAAADKPNGLAVLGTFYELSATDNPLLGFLDRALSNDTLVMANGAVGLTVSPSDFNIFSKLLPSDTDSFFRYDGSLTTPNCYESVLWTVYKQTVPISERQLNLFRRLKYTDNSTMTNNFRPPLLLNPGIRPGTPRTVYRTFSAGSAAPPMRVGLGTVAGLAMLARLIGATVA